MVQSSVVIFSSFVVVVFDSIDFLVVFSILYGVCIFEKMYEIFLKLCYIFNIFKICF